MKNILIVFFSFISLNNAYDLYLNPSTCQNQTNCLQYGLDTLKSYNGGRLFLEEKEYTVDKNVIIYGNTTVIGKGMNKTIIKLADFAPPFKVGVWQRAGLIRAIFDDEGGCDNIVIVNLTIDGNKEKQHTDYDHQYGRYGLYTEACKNVLFDGVEIHSMQGYGFDPHGKKPSDYGFDLVIKNSIAHHNDWDGFTLDQTINIVVDNCTSYYNGRHGFNIVTGSKNTTLSNVYTYNNGFYYYMMTKGCGIAMQDNLEYGTMNMTVQNAYLFNDYRAGVCTNGAIKHLTLTNITIDNFDRCIHLAPNGSDVSITNVECENANRFMMSNNFTNIYTFNNTLNGTLL